ncbi:DUF3025 domain-containing protein [Pulveribacter suum]|uniref:DUF3025 domain-containing protein n=1 Tax=Pulveribacter suum TaxID=2116657 RepID=A0A2P1NIW6_9BURK|nr:DUF3025 domain-containing protein [Pulveribacter suum]AVP56920.1 DUF3025 domain-containing protein [Pulveribacter suum]
MAPPASLHGIDWQRPWLADLAAPGRRAAALVAQGACVAEALNALVAAGHAPDPGVRFAPQQALTPGTAYEQFIFEQRRVPTRDNLHDFFNGLIWLHWPLAKGRLNALQAGAIARAGVGATRGPLRDAITVLDENGAVLCAPAPLHQALAARQWRRAFVELRPLWGCARLLLFGHALLEKLVHPRKPITAHVCQAPAAIETVAQADAWLADWLHADTLAAKPFNPVPVLGVPGWCGGNEAACFYDDPLVFRSPRAA